MSPRRPRSRKAELAGSSLLLFLLFVAAVMLYNAWKASNASPLPAQTPQQATELSKQTPPQKTANSPVVLPVPTESVSAGDAISVWFSDPLSGKTSGGPETHLIAAIDSAQKSVDMAIYNLSLDSVGDALLNAKQRGVAVRLVMESEAMEKRVPSNLRDAGIKIVGDQREGLMHNKFTIIDGEQVWMGSMNYTSTSFYTDFNNLVCIKDPQAAADYQAAFDEMFEKHQFGPDKVMDTPFPQVSVGDTPVEVYFSPDDGVQKQIVSELQQARKSVVFLAYSFTSNPIAKALAERSAAGVTIRGIMDEGQQESNIGGEYAAFKKAGYDVKLDGIPGLQHSKVIIIDGKVVITGSYNFTSSAERTNDENVVIIHNAEIADAYLKYFDVVYNSTK